MGKVDSERKQQAIDELFEKHGSFDDTFLNENDQLHVGFAVQKVTKVIHDSIEKGIELANGNEGSDGESLPT